MITTYDYAPFGAVTQGGTNLDNAFQFCSEYADSELGLVYYNFRHYNPTDGRWINRDPIAEQGGYNLYAMVANNPANAWDVLGHKVIYIDNIEETPKHYCNANIIYDISKSKSLINKNNNAIKTINKITKEEWNELQKKKKLNLQEEYIEKIRREAESKWITFPTRSSL